MNEIEGKQEVISCEVLKLIDIIEKLTDRIKDIDMNMRAIYLHIKDQDKLKKESFILHEKLNKNLNCKVLGPVEAPIFKIKKNYRNRILIRAKKDLNIQIFKILWFLNGYLNYSM